MEKTLTMSSNDLFGGDVPDDVRALVDAAREAPPDQVAGILWAALALSPACLSVYYLLYKLHASRGELEPAERAARAALAEAGRQAGLPGTADGEPRPTAEFDFGVPGAARFWLFTLKALAFISARRGQLSEARRLLAWIGAYDPSHSVGSEVTTALVDAAETVTV